MQHHSAMDIISSTLKPFWKLKLVKEDANTFPTQPTDLTSLASVGFSPFFWFDVSETCQLGRHGHHFIWPLMQCDSTLKSSWMTERLTPSWRLRAAYFWTKLFSTFCICCILFFTFFFWFLTRAHDHGWGLVLNQPSLHRNWLEQRPQDLKILKPFHLIQQHILNMTMTRACRCWFHSWLLHTWLFCCLMNMTVERILSVRWQFSDASRSLPL